MSDAKPDASENDEPDTYETDRAYSNGREDTIDLLTRITTENPNIHWSDLVVKLRHGTEAPGARTSKLDASEVGDITEPMIRKLWDHLREKHGGRELTPKEKASTIETYRFVRAESEAELYRANERVEDYKRALESAKEARDAADMLLAESEGESDEARAKALYRMLRDGYPTGNFPSIYTPTQLDFWVRAVRFVRAESEGRIRELEARLLDAQRAVKYQCDRLSEQAEQLEAIRAALCKLADVELDTGETTLEIVGLVARDRAYADKLLREAEVKGGAGDSGTVKP